MRRTNGRFLFVVIIQLPWFLGVGQVLSDVPRGIGILGDSDSDEYAFTESDGQFVRTGGQNWLELLAATRQLNFGEWSSDSRPFPRLQGYEFNWGHSGDTATGGLSRQLEGLLDQVKSGQVTLVFNELGDNDFAIRYNDIANEQLAGEDLTTYIDDVARAIHSASIVLRNAGDVNLVLSTIQDPGAWTLFNQVGTVGGQRVTDAVMRFNQQVEAFASTRGYPIVDVFSLGNLSLNGDLVIGGVSVNPRGSGSDPRNFWIDGVHFGTVVSGLYANAFVRAANEAYGTNIAPLSDQEILRAAELISGVDVPYDPSIETFFDVSPFVLANPPRFSKLLELVDSGDAWKLYRGKQEPSAFPQLGWTGVDFDDREWEIGSLPVGFSERADSSLVFSTALNDMRDNYSSVYLRHRFSVPNADSVEQLEIQIGYDDAFVAYLNGVEIARSSGLDSTDMPLPFNQLPAFVHSVSPPLGFVIDLADFPGLLREGDDNLLAIQGFNRRLTDPDFAISDVRIAAWFVPESGSTLGPGLLACLLTIWQRASFPRRRAHHGA